MLMAERFHDTERITSKGAIAKVKHTENQGISQQNRKTSAGFRGTPGRKGALASSLPQNGGPDAFVHTGAVERSGPSDLREGEKVTIELVAGQAHGKDVCGADKDPRLSPTYRPEWKAGRAAAALSRRAGYAAFQITNSPLSSK